MNKPGSSTETVETNVGNKCREESQEQEPKKNFTNNASMCTTSSCFSLVVTTLFPPSFYVFTKAPTNHLEVVVFMLDVLAIGSGHLLMTSHLCSGLTGHRLALCIVVGGLLGQLVIVRRSALLLDCHCPYSLLVGPLVVVRRYASSSNHPSCH